MTAYQHPDYLGFLRSIIAAPDDDAPRLALADWLDEHGEAERAAFIRWQLGVPRLQPDGRDCFVVAAQVPGPRERTEVWVAGGAESAVPAWVQALRLPVFRRGHWYTFRAAFVEVVRPHPADWITVGGGDTMTWDPAGGRDCPTTAHPVREVFFYALISVDDEDYRPRKPPGRWRLYALQSEIGFMREC